MAIKRVLAFAFLISTVAASADPGSELEACTVRHLPADVAPANRLAALEQSSTFCHGLALDARRLTEQDATNAIYANQIVQNRILLTMVVFLTLAGVVLSTVQLWASYKLAIQGRGTLPDGGEVSLSTGSLAVKSSVVGVVILALSLGFFVVFATQVYRLRPIDIAPEAQVPRTSPEAQGPGTSRNGASPGGTVKGTSASVPDSPPAGMREFER